MSMYKLRRCTYMFILSPIFDTLKYDHKRLEMQHQLLIKYHKSLKAATKSRPHCNRLKAVLGN